MRKAGIDVSRFPSLQYPAFRRFRQLQHHGVDLVMDVGASEGGYAAELRSFGYAGRILSFEPLEESFQELAKRVASDPLWEVHNVAIGARRDVRILNVSKNRVSSSLSSMLPEHLGAAPESQLIDRRPVEVHTLDEFARKVELEHHSAFLKIDVQGAETEVLEGGSWSLPRLRGVQIELALMPLYEGDMPLQDGVERFADLGFSLSSVEPGFTDPRTGDVLQVDATFFRTPRPRSASPERATAAIEPGRHDVGER